MNNKFKKILIAAVLLTGFTLLQAKEAYYSGEDYNISLSYNDTAKPGDAVFVRMELTPKAIKKKAGNSNTTTATVSLFSKKEKIDSIEFFNIDPKKNGRGTVDLLAGLPLSTWTKEGSYSLTVTYTPFGNQPMKFTIPLTVDQKDFQKETIPLDTANTAIKTDVSPERLSQIYKLNDILKNIDPEIYQLTPFVLPVDSTRRTALFGDRRIYSYANGKSSTDIHTGIDFGVPTGTPVSACAAGKVVMAEKRISTGWTVVIEHMPGLYSLYYHMDSLLVKTGKIVKQGEKIGVSGATGLATGPHLHWEIRLDGAAVNPDFFTNNFAFTNTPK